MPRRPKRIIRSAHSLPLEHGPLIFDLTQSSQRKSICITITDKARVRVAAPYHSPIGQVYDFIRLKSSWIYRKLHEAQRLVHVTQNRKFTQDQEFMFLGKKYPLKFRDTNQKTVKISFSGDQWNIFTPQGFDRDAIAQDIKTKFTQWYRQQAQEVLGTRTFYYSRLMKVTPGEISVRTQKRLWGSCHHSTQKINLNWKLILTPLEVIDYVVVHELCHLIVPNHSKRFWNKVKQFFPQFNASQRWLKDNAIDLILPA